MARPVVNWNKIDQMRKGIGVPVLMKGILTPKEAGEALKHGIDGIVVSNYGGLLTPGMASSMEMLPSIVEAVGGSAGPDRWKLPSRLGYLQGARIRRDCRDAGPAGGVGPGGLSTRGRAASAGDAADRSRARYGALQPPRSRISIAPWSSCTKSKRQVGDLPHLTSSSRACLSLWRS